MQMVRVRGNSVGIGSGVAVMIILTGVGGMVVRVSVGGGEGVRVGSGWGGVQAAQMMKIRKRGNVGFIITFY
jgi:hypothetical protein